MNSTYTPNDFITLLHNEGYRAAFDSGINGTSTITSGSGGNIWTIEFRVEGEYDDATVARFMHHIWVNPIQYPIGKICNETNMNGFVGTAQFAMPDPDDEDKDTLLIFDHELVFTGGVTLEWISHQLLNWDLALTEFIKILEANEELAFDSGALFE
jgi:hypothetical protein